MSIGVLLAIGWAGIVFLAQSIFLSMGRISRNGVDYIWQRRVMAVHQAILASLLITAAVHFFLKN